MDTHDKSRSCLEVSWEITLLGEFAARRNKEPVLFAPAVSRVVAYLALQARPVTREHLAGVLWLDASQRSAFANLRSTLWRLRQIANVLVQVDGQLVGLAPAAEIDLWAAVEAADRLDRQCPTPGDVHAVCDYFTHELLPRWSDDWILLERERHRQRSLHALETLVECFSRDGHHGKAIDLALAAIAMDPLRESAHRALIEAHLAEGNYSEAVSRHDAYISLLRSELGIDPSPLLNESLMAILG